MSQVNQYKASLKVIEAEEIVDLLFFRPLAFLFVRLIYSTSLTPNQVSIISMVCGIMAGVSFGMASEGFVFLGGVLLALSTVFDCADGQLARLKSGTFFGRLLDGAIDYISTISVFLGIGFWGAAVLDDPVQWWVIVAITGVTYAVQAALVDYYRSEYITNAQGRSDFVVSELRNYREKYEELKQARGQWPKKILLGLYIRYSRIQSANRRGPGVAPDEYIRSNRLLVRLWNLNGTATHAFVLVLAALLNKLDWYVWYILIIGNLWTLAMWMAQRINERESLLLEKPPA